MAVHTLPFLTKLDSRAEVKGSRDPLGVQPIWSRLGRHVVGNLSTVTTSVKDFVTLLVGCYFSEQLVETSTRPREEAETEVDYFLKWEQVVAYSRHVFGQSQFRGIDKVKRNLFEQNGRVDISASRSAQILSNQKAYGVWGMYLGPARASGLIEPLLPRLTSEAREFVEEAYVKRLHHKIPDLRAFLQKASSPFDPRGRHEPLASAVADLFSRKVTPLEHSFFQKALVLGGPGDSTGGLQSELAALVAVSPSRYKQPKRKDVLDLRSRARQTGHESLAYRLDRICASEAVFAPAQLLFSYLLGCDGQQVETLERNVTEAWGNSVPTVDLEAFADLRPEIRKATSDDSLATSWQEIADRLSRGLFADLIRHLIDHNRLIMKTRDGSPPWLEEQQGKLRVRFREEGGLLPPRKELIDWWNFNYFIPPLAFILSELEEA